MKKELNFFCIFFLPLFLSGCAAQAVPSHLMQPSEQLSSQIPKDFYLQHKIKIGTVLSQLPSKPLNKNYYTELLANARDALELALQTSKLLAKDDKEAIYELNAALIDIKDPSCFWGTCETGSTIKYTLKKVSNNKEVYSELLVVPQNTEFPIIGADINQVLLTSYGSALGNNYAHLIHVLANKDKGDLK